MKTIRNMITGFFIMMTLFSFHLNSASAQNPVGIGQTYHPINQYSAPGVASVWAGGVGKAIPGHFQQVEFILPTEGKVTLFYNNGSSSETQMAPMQAGLSVGYVYRFQISEMEDFPGQSLYPTVELIDHTHPPKGMEDKFPVPIEFTREEIAVAFDGSMVTKIIYLEDPRTANVFPPLNGERADIKTVDTDKNLMKEADLLGRPMAIIRLGARQPDRFSADRQFFAGNGPIRIGNKQID